MSILTVLLVAALIYAIFTFFPRTGYTTPGYAPISVGGIFAIILILWLLGVFGASPLHGGRL